MACCGFVFAGIAAAAHAQNAPLPGGGWLPLTQSSAVIDDPFDGNPPYASYLDILGDKATAPVFVSSDVDYLYFRMRVAGSPFHTGGVNRLYAGLWACLLDIDQQPQTFELLAGLDGTQVPNTVVLYENTSTAQPDDITDPAEVPVALSGATTNWSYSLAGSTLGGSGDYFLDWQVNWTDLATAGFTNTMPFRLVCGTGTSATSATSASLSGGDMLDGGSGSKSFSTDASDAVLCDDNGCRYYDPLFKDGFEGP